MPRTERRRLIKQEILPVVSKMLDEVERKGDAPPAEIWIDDDTILKFEVVRVV
jgi:hypothetical protein